MLSALNDGGERSKMLLTRLAEQPKSPAIIGVAELLFEQGRYSEVVTRLRSVAEFYGDIYRFNLVLARALRNAGEIEPAKQHYEKACQIAPQNEVAMKELIALTAFPHAMPKPSLHSVEQAVERETAPTIKSHEHQANEPEIPSVFKLDREKIAKALGGVIGSMEKSGDASVETQKPVSSAQSAASSVVEAFRKADNLLEGEPDIDALAREMMGGNAFMQQEMSPPAPLKSFESDISSSQNRTASESTPPPKVAEPLQQSTVSEADIDAIARQILGISGSDEPTQASSLADSPIRPASPTPTQSASASEPVPIPLDENGNPIIRIDRNKLTQALSGIYRARGIAPSTVHAGERKDDDNDDMPFPVVTKASESRTPESPPLTSPIEPASQSGSALSFEEEIMAMQMQGGDIDAFISNKDTAHHEQDSDVMPSNAPPPMSNEYDIDALAREIMSAQLPKVVETNDPTPVSEQRQPFSDDEEIKTPTRQLAKIFQAQGAYAKAIKVYEMLAIREPENASLYDILISELRDKMASK